MNDEQIMIILPRNMLIYQSRIIIGELINMGNNPGEWILKHLKKGDLDCRGIH